MLLDLLCCFVLHWFFWGGGATKAPLVNPNHWCCSRNRRRTARLLTFCTSIHRLSSPAIATILLGRSLTHPRAWTRYSYMILSPCNFFNLRASSDNHQYAKIWERVVSSLVNKGFLFKSMGVHGRRVIRVLAAQMDGAQAIQISKISLRLLWLMIVAGFANDFLGWSYLNCSLGIFMATQRCGINSRHYALPCLHRSVM